MRKLKIEMVVEIDDNELYKFGYIPEVFDIDLRQHVAERAEQFLGSGGAIDYISSTRLKEN